MSMPKIPEEKFRPSLSEVLVDILKSIALEETALSHILNAEGEKNQLIIQKLQHCKDERSIKELNNSMKQTEKIINTILMKEWLLLRKMETVGEIKSLIKTHEEKDKGCKHTRHVDEYTNFTPSKNPQFKDKYDFGKDELNDNDC